MNLFKNVKTIFLDYDGTLHDSIKIYAPAFKKAYTHLVENKLATLKTWTDDEISYWLGFSPKDMWNEFMPDLDDEIKNYCSNIIANEMNSQLKQKNAELYEGALETLAYLNKKGYDLVFISNCGIYYKDMANELFSLDNYFKALFCSEEFNYIKKSEILKNIKNNYDEDMVIIGDRKQDIDAGIKNNIYTIGCSFGFGDEDELAQADIIIDDIRKLKKILKN